VERVAEAVWQVLQRPRRLVCVPRSMRLVSGIEQWLGWLLDRAPMDPNLRTQLTQAGDSWTRSSPCTTTAT
ncbi:MAG: hypothetical protein J2P15_23920, partial [Micromonosporaceae bacterium]|nr:hypothetical protein [Micromonosporaceae bacterium]